MSTLYDGRFLRIKETNGWEFCERRNCRDAVVVVALDETTTGLILVEQYRPPVGNRVIELPAGLLDKPGESAEDAGMRELLEETGYKASCAKVLFSGPVSPGMSNEQVVFIRARGVQKVEAGGGIEGERITVHVVPVQRVSAFLDSKVRSGILVDPKVYVGYYSVVSELQSL